MIDLHSHTFFSDGALVPSEHVRRFEQLGYVAIAITDHADASNIHILIPNLLKVAKVLGIPKASLGNWVRLSAKGELDGAGGGDKSNQVSPEQMEIARLRAENARLRMERDIAKKAAAYFAQDTLRGTPGFTK